MTSLRSFAAAAVLACAACGQSGDAFVVEKPPLDTFIVDHPAARTGEATARITFRSTRVAQTFACVLDGVALPCGASVMLSGLTVGDHRITASAIDGDEVDATPAVFGWTVDDTAPSPPLIGVGAPELGNDNHPIVYIRHDEAALIRVFRGSCVTGTRVAEVRTVFTRPEWASAQLHVDVADNTTTTFTALAIDGAGHVSACSSPHTYVEDSLPPLLTFSHALGPIVTDAPIDFDHDGERVRSLTCLLDDVPVACDEPIPLYDVAPGRHTRTLVATDFAGNVGRTSSSFERHDRGAAFLFGSDMTGVPVEHDLAQTLTKLTRDVGAPVILVYTGGATEEETFNLDRALRDDDCCGLPRTPEVEHFTDAAELPARLSRVTALVIADLNVPAGAPALQALAAAGRPVVRSWVRRGGLLVILSGRTPAGEPSGTYTLASSWDVMQVGEAALASGMVVRSDLGVEWTAPPGSVAFATSPGPLAGVPNEEAAGRSFAYSLHFRTYADFDQSAIATWPWSPWTSSLGSGAIVELDGSPALRGPGSLELGPNPAYLDTLAAGNRVLVRVRLPEVDGAVDLDLQGQARAELRRTGPGACVARFAAGAVAREAVLADCQGSLLFAVEASAAPFQPTQTRAAVYSASGALLGATAPITAFVPARPALTLEGAAIIDDLVYAGRSN